MSYMVKSNDKEEIRRKTTECLTFASKNDLWCVVDIRKDLMCDYDCVEASYFDSRINAESFMSSLKERHDSVKVPYYVYTNLGFSSNVFLDGGLFG